MTFTVLLLLVPASLALDYAFHASALWVFASATLAIVPLAEWIRRATVQVARAAGPAVGGLLNVSFGNAAELILALFVLRSGHEAVVKGQITGSIIGNGLLGLGLAILVGSWTGGGRPQQTFDRERAGLLSSLLVLTVIALLLPAFFDLTERRVLTSGDAGRLDERLSLAVSVVLIGVYAANLVYTLYTHRDIFANDHGPEAKKGGAEGEEGGKEWSLWVSLGVLAIATAATALEAHLVSGALESTATRLHVSAFFLGVIVLAVIGNSAEYMAAIYFARRNQMDMVLRITVGSSIQVALLVAPVLVLASYFLGSPMNLVFNSPLELIAIAAVAFAVKAIAQDGKTTWFEGLLLVSIYALLAFAFFFAAP